MPPTIDYYDAMRLAIAQAHEATTHGDIPIGCVIHDGSTVVSTGHNNKEQTNDPTGHAEIVAIRNAAQRLNSWHLDGLTLVVTLEPCPMCAGAIVQSRIKTVVYGASDPKAGAVRSLLKLADDHRFNHRCEIVEGIMEQECGDVLTDFFAGKRAEP